MKKYLFLLSTLVLSGCLLVEDFGTYWEQGFDDRCITAIARAHYLDDKHKKRSDTELTQMLRSLKVGAHTFLMLKDDMGAKRGLISRYEVKDGKYIAYGIKDGMDARFETDYPNAPIKLEGGGMAGKLAKVHTLTPEVIKIVESVASTPDYWIETNKTAYNPTNLKECTQ